MLFISNPIYILLTIGHINGGGYIGAVILNFLFSLCALVSILTGQLVAMKWKTDPLEINGRVETEKDLLIEDAQREGISYGTLTSI